MANLGMLVLWDGQDPIDADLVFIHGLRGDRLKTWSKDGVVWPRDLLPSRLPNTRIMAWGYDADVMTFFPGGGNTSQSSIFQHAKNLLEDLQDERLGREEALCMASDERFREHNPRGAALGVATVGVIFAGTPHRGSNKALWASIASNVAKVVLKDQNDKVVDALNRGSETLERLQFNFSPIIPRLKIFTLLEDHNFSKTGKIVDDDSATLGSANERQRTIPADHIGMVKFDDVSSLGFKRTVGALSEIIESCASTPDEVAASSATTDRRRSLPMKRRSVRRAQTQFAVTMEAHAAESTKLLSFAKGEVIEDLVLLPGHFWRGRISRRTGLFPRDAVDVYDAENDDTFRDTSSILSLGTKSAAVQEYLDQQRELLEESGSLAALPAIEEVPDAGPSPDLPERQRSPPEASPSRHSPRHSPQLSPAPRSPSRLSPSPTPEKLTSPLASEERRTSPHLLTAENLAVMETHRGRSPRIGGSPSNSTSANPTATLAVRPTSPEPAAASPSRDLSPAHNEITTLLCPWCTEELYAHGFADRPALEEHIGSVHSYVLPSAKEDWWICIDASGQGDLVAIPPLAECRFCRGRQRYWSLVTAMRHLCRTHFRHVESMQDVNKQREFLLGFYQNDIRHWFYRMSNAGLFEDVTMPWTPGDPGRPGARSQALDLCYSPPVATNTSLPAWITGPLGPAGGASATPSPGSFDASPAWTRLRLQSTGRSENSTPPVLAVSSPSPSAGPASAPVRAPPYPATGPTSTTGPISATGPTSATGPILAVPTSVAAASTAPASAAAETPAYLPPLGPSPSILKSPFLPSDDFPPGFPFDKDDFPPGFPFDKPSRPPPPTTKSRNLAGESLGRSPAAPSPPLSTTVRHSTLRGSLPPPPTTNMWKVTADKATEIPPSSTSKIWKGIADTTTAAPPPPPPTSKIWKDIADNTTEAPPSSTAHVWKWIAGNATEASPPSVPIKNAWAKSLDRPAKASVRPAMQTKTSVEKGVAGKTPEKGEAAREPRRLGDGEKGARMLLAAAKGDVAQARALLAKGAKLGYFDADGLNPLHRAAAGGHSQMAQLLLEHGAEVDGRTLDQRTALHLAIQASHIAVARILFHYGANLNATDLDDKAPLYHAASIGYLLGIIELVKAGALVDGPRIRSESPLHVAAGNGHLNAVATLCDLKADLEATDSRRMTAVHRAAIGGHNTVIYLLLDRGAMIDPRDNKGRTPLFWAVALGRESTLKWLQRRGADVNAVDSTEQPPILEAAASGSCDIVEVLLKAGVSASTKGPLGNTPLHLAAKKGDGPTVDLLTQKLGSASKPNDNMETAMHMAAAYGHAHLIGKLCMYSDSDPLNVHDRWGATPLHRAASANHELTVEELTLAGADCEACDMQQRTPLHHAAMKDSAQAAQTLVDAGANMDVRDEDDATPLFRAAERGSIVTLDLLLKRGASMTAATRQHQTPLHAAAGLGRDRAVEILLQHQAPVGGLVAGTDARFNFTPLHEAARHGSSTIVKMLLKHGAVVDAADAQGNTALHHAAQQGHEDLVRLLFAKGADLHHRNHDGRTPLDFARASSCSRQLVADLEIRPSDCAVSS
ncbi:MAG: Ankyrin-1 [Thelocarpon superellum]|nr:MAG: Ankyrin-1 [Thelocarpon superellum]